MTQLVTNYKEEGGGEILVIIERCALQLPVLKVNLKSNFPAPFNIIEVRLGLIEQFFTL